jgi:hypothetical protein
MNKEGSYRWQRRRGNVDLLEFEIYMYEIQKELCLQNFNEMPSEMPRSQNGGKPMRFHLNIEDFGQLL